MGTPKPLLDWFGKPLVLAQVDSLLEAGVDRVVVVTGASDCHVAPLLVDKANVVARYNPDFVSGKASSVRVGASAIEDGMAAIVLLAVDQPRPTWVIKHVLASHQASGALITSPRYAGHGGHPLVFSGALKSELGSVTDEREGVREIMARYRGEINEVGFDSPIVRVDLNTPDDYVTAQSGYVALSAAPARMVE